METVHEAINDLAGAFEEFKSTNDHRLNMIENKGNVDSLIDHKLSRLNSEMDRAYDRLNKLQLSTQRPLLGEAERASSFEQQEHKTAFLHYIRKGDETKLYQLEQKALTTGSDAEGGYLVPHTVSDRIGQEMGQLSPIRSLASIMTISTSALELLVDRDKPEVGWVAETAERPETAAPKMAKLSIPVHELYAKPRATQKLLDDSRINIEEWLVGRIASKMAQVENQAFVNGDGTNKPKGFMTYPTVALGNLEAGKIEHILTGTEGAFGENQPGDILFDAINAMKVEYLKDAVWLMSRSTLSAARKLKSAEGQYLWQPSLSEELSQTLLGYKVIVLEDLPPLVQGTASKSIVFANLKEGYQIVDRAGTQVLRDPFSAKPYVEFYTTKRVGGDVIDTHAFKIIKFSR